MTSRPEHSGTLGGALDIGDQHVAPIGSDADLKQGQESERQGQAAPDPKEEKGDAGTAGVQPVERFDPPPRDDRRIFQNGDTDRNG